MTEEELKRLEVLCQSPRHAADCNVELDDESDHATLADAGTCTCAVGALPAALAEIRRLRAEAIELKEQLIGCRGLLADAHRDRKLSGDPQPDKRQHSSIPAPRTNSMASCRTCNHPEQSHSDFQCNAFGCRCPGFES